MKLKSMAFFDSWPSIKDCGASGSKFEPTAANAFNNNDVGENTSVLYRRCLSHPSADSTSSCMAQGRHVENDFGRTLDMLRQRLDMAMVSHD